MADLQHSGDRASDGPAYDRLLARAISLAREIAAAGPESAWPGAPASYIIPSASRLAAATPPSPPEAEAAPGDAGHVALDILETWWRPVCAGETTGEAVLSSARGARAWYRIMHDWPMGDYAAMAADFLIRNACLGGRVLELGAGVGNTSKLIRDHVGPGYLRTDAQPAMLAAFDLPGETAIYDFDTPGPWQDLDTCFAVNALHCARDKAATLGYIRAMLRPGGLLLLAEGAPVTTPAGTPWALDTFFGLFKGWYDRGGFLPRATWLDLLARQGFSDLGYSRLTTPEHDLGGLVFGRRA